MIEGLLLRCIDNAGVSMWEVSSTEGVLLCHYNGSSIQGILS